MKCYACRRSRRIRFALYLLTKTGEKLRLRLPANSMSNAHPSRNGAATQFWLVNRIHPSYNSDTITVRGVFTSANEDGISQPAYRDGVLDCTCLHTSKPASGSGCEVHASLLKCRAPITQILEAVARIIGSDVCTPAPFRTNHSPAYASGSNVACPTSRQPLWSTSRSIVFRQYAVDLRFLQTRHVCDLPPHVDSHKNERVRSDH